MIQVEDKRYVHTGSGLSRTSPHATILDLKDVSRIDLDCSYTAELRVRFWTNGVQADAIITPSSKDLSSMQVNDDLIAQLNWLIGCWKECRK